MANNTVNGTAFPRRLRLYSKAARYLGVGLSQITPRGTGTINRYTPPKKKWRLCRLQPRFRQLAKPSGPGVADQIPWRITSFIKSASNAFLIPLPSQQLSRGKRGRRCAVHPIWESGCDRSAGRPGFGRPVGLQVPARCGGGGKSRDWPA